MDLKKLYYTFSTLSELGEEVTSTRNFQQTIRRSLLMVLGTLSITRGAIWARQDGQTAFDLLASKGLRKEDPSQLV